MIQDHFNQADWDRTAWCYYNMNSPCFNPPERVGDSALKLYEYDMFNEGNCLLSRRFTVRQAAVRAVVCGVEDPMDGGACIGFYAGNGAFTDYVLLSAGVDRLEILVPSGAQRGASFMDAGQPQQTVLASCPYNRHFPMELELRRDGNTYTAYLDGLEVLSVTAYTIKGDARAMIKALHRRDDRYVPLYTLFDSATVLGEAPTASLQGCITDGEGHPVAGASVHLAGFDDQFTQADAQGQYHLNAVPRGEHVLVAAAEGYSFARKTVFCQSGMDNRADVSILKETAETLPRREYNNPSFDRSASGWLCLNGTWQFQFDPENTGEKAQWYASNAAPFDKVIRVPFSWASLMGFGEEHLACGDDNHEANTVMNNFNITGRFGWYRRSVVIPKTFPADQHTILHIGASNCITNAWIDGRYLGMRIDEYADLEFDLGVLQPGSTHNLVIKVEYAHYIKAHNMGKQLFWFSSAPGIWQSVWIEPRRPTHIRAIRIRPELTFEAGQLTDARFLLEGEAVNAEGMQLRVQILDPFGAQAGCFEFPIHASRVAGQLPIESPVLWQYREGRLYTFDCALLSNGAAMDQVRTLSGLRKVETRWLPGHSPEETDDVQNQYQYLYLNDKPFYVIGILDQGYNAFGIYTYRSYDAEGHEGKRGSIAYEVDRTLAYGYNLSRMHIKENEPLWYHECDRKGLLVWTEHPGNFFATPDNPDWQAAYNRELDGMLNRLYNHPSVVIISSINESWGVEGCHLSTPWKNELRYQFLRRNALVVKERNPHVLVCDNSGFGKTEACEINDFHYYPNDYFKAHAKWSELVENCYPGSIFNYINAAHGEGCIGNAVQTGRPIYVSEFLHINGIDMQLRMFEKIAGYLRMNVASHEVENSGPLTAERFERDYGYVDADMNPLGYDMVNSMDHVVPHLNRITHVHTGEELSIPLYTSHFAWRAVAQPRLCWTLTGIDALGRYCKDRLSGEREIEFRQFCVQQQKPLEITVPSGIRGAYLFLWIADGEEILCRNYVQLVVDDAVSAIEGAKIYPIPPTSYTDLSSTGFCGTYRGTGASLFWANARSSVSYEIELEGGASSGTLLFEAGAREGIGAVKVTDEIKHPTSIDLFVDGHHIGCVHPSDDPSDERALFTNATLGGRPFNYRNLGQYGYGERFEVELPAELLAKGRHRIRFDCGDGGMTLYGEGMGRYGFHPCLVLK